MIPNLHPPSLVRLSVIMSSQDHHNYQFYMQIKQSQFTTIRILAIKNHKLHLKHQNYRITVTDFKSSAEAPFTVRLEINTCHFSSRAFPVDQQTWTRTDRRLCGGNNHCFVVLWQSGKRWIYCKKQKRDLGELFSWIKLVFVDLLKFL